MIGGSSYQVARPPFVFPGPWSSSLARAPPRAVQAGLQLGLNTPKG
jgi:hypothetical protein